MQRAATIWLLLMMAAPSWRGVSGVKIDSSSVDTTGAFSWTPTEAEGPGGQTSIAYQPTFSIWTEDLMPDQTPRNSFLFPEDVTARYVQLTVDDTFFVDPGDGTGGGVPGGDRAGLGEIAFEIPEPATLLLMAAGGLGMLLRRNR